MPEHLYRAHLRRLQLEAGRYVRAGVLPLELIDELAWASADLWVFTGDEPDA